MYNLYFAMFNLSKIRLKAVICGFLFLTAFFATFNSEASDLYAGELDMALAESSYLNLSQNRQTTLGSLQASVHQEGDNNSLQLNTSGQSNSFDILQKGQGNHADIWIEGSGNQLVVHQIGDHNLVEFSQYGHHNLTTIEQVGYFNQVNIELTADSLVSKISQFGNGMQATIKN